MLGKELLKKTRYELCLTQQDFGALFGIDKCTISMYETGERKPGLKNIKKICDGLEKIGIKIKYSELMKNFKEV